MTSPPRPPDQRYHHLDALRATALLLGIVFHAVLAYVPFFMNPSIKWAVVDQSTSHLLGGLAFLNHVFRIEVFYLIAGFFAHLVYHRRGFQAFVRARVIRILVPFFVGWLVLYPAFIYLWVWGQASCGLSELPENMRGWSPMEVTSWLIARPGYVLFTRGVTLTHLWFLWYLVVLYALTLGLRSVALRVGSAASLHNQADRAVTWLMTSCWGLFLLAAFIGSLLGGMRWWFGVDTPFRQPLPWALVPDFKSLGVYFTFFAIGWLLHRQPGLLDQIATRWKRNTLGGLALSLSLSAFLMSRYDAASAAQIEASAMVKGIYSWAYALAMVLLVVGVLGLFVRFLPRESRVWRYIADSSYWLYIIHLPIVVWLQVMLYPYPFPCYIKSLLVLVIAMPLMLLTYHYAVRSTFIGQILNGRRYPKQPLPGLRVFIQFLKCPRAQ